MTDRLTPERRSWNMSRIRGRDTAPERAVRSLLHRMGYRFRLHSRSLPGSPDLVLPRYRTVILVNGCFWHQHRGCPFAYVPKTRVEFWKEKLRKNEERDRRTVRELCDLGWRVLTVWECETRELDGLAKRLDDALENAIRNL